MAQFYSFDDLSLLRVEELPVQGSPAELRGNDAQRCDLISAVPESVQTPRVVYKGRLPLHPTEPNLLAEWNPDLLFPTFMPGHPLSVARLPDAVCVDGGIILTQSSRVYAESFRQLSRMGHRIGLELVGDAKFRLTTVPRTFSYCEGKCLLLDGEHFAAYGHFVGEIMTRLWIARHIDMPSMKIICGKVIAPYLWPLLEACGIQQEQVVFNEGAIFCEELWVPSQSFLVRQSITSAARITWDAVGSHFDRKSGPERIYISRSKINHRPLKNEQEVEKLFETHGFQVIHPQQLSIRDQINIFRNAKWLAGCSGSNMFNCCFCSLLDQHKLFLTSRNYILHTDVLLNNKANPPITFLIGEPDVEHSVHSPWEVDLGLLTETLHSWLSE
jgi:capsular polysaccharide biosynthesis protein